MKKLILGVGDGGANYVLNTVNHLQGYDRWVSSGTEYDLNLKVTLINYAHRSNFLKSDDAKRLKQYSEVWLVCCLGGRYGSDWLETYLEFFWQAGFGSAHMVSETF